MADDGSGVYSKLGASVAVTATTIASNPYNVQNDDYVTALNARLNINGTKPMAGNLAMGGNKATGLAVGTTPTDAATVGQIQSGIVAHSASVGGTVDVITAVHAPVMTTWVGMTGTRGIFTATGANTSATPTFNPDGIGAKTLVKLNNLPLVAGDIIGAGHEVEWEYNGTNVVILNPARIGNSTISMVSKAINEAKGAAVASSGTTDIWTPADGNYVHVTGTTTITSLGTAPQAGAERTVIFDGILTLTHNATTLVLPGGANITTAANDRMVVRADTTANMIVVDYTKASGLPVVAPVTTVTIFKSADESRTSTTTLANDTHLTFSMLANTNYKINLRYFIDQTPSNAGIKVGISGPASPTSVLFGSLLTTTGTYTAPLLSFSTSATASVSIPQTGGTGLHAWFDAEIIWRNGANAGTFVIQTAQETSRASATTFKSGSSLSYLVF